MNYQQMKQLKYQQWVYYIAEASETTMSGIGNMGLQPIDLQHPYV